MHKTNAVFRRSAKSGMVAAYGRCGNAIRSPFGANGGRSAIACGFQWRLQEIIRRSMQSHCVSVLIQTVIHLIALLQRLCRAVTEVNVLLKRFYRFLRRLHNIEELNGINLEYMLINMHCNMTDIRQQAVLLVAYIQVQQVSGTTTEGPTV
jgi:hypothetical protein